MPNLLLHLAAQVLARVNLTRYNLRATDALLDTSSNVLAILGTSAITNTAGSSCLLCAVIAKTVIA